MSVSDGLLVGGLTIFTVAAGVLAVRLWRTPAYADQAQAAFGWIPFSDNVRRGTVRGAVARVAMLAALSVLIGVAGVEPDTAGLGFGTIWSAANTILFAILAMSGLFQLSIILINRPKWIVPPFMRAEQGLLGRKGE